MIIPKQKSKFKLAAKIFAMAAGAFVFLILSASSASPAWAQGGDAGSAPAGNSSASPAGRTPEQQIEYIDQQLKAAGVVYVSLGCDDLIKSGQISSDCKDIADKIVVLGEQKNRLQTQLLDDEWVKLDCKNQIGSNGPNKSRCEDIRNEKQKLSDELSEGAYDLRVTNQTDPIKVAINSQNKSTCSFPYVTNIKACLTDLALVIIGAIEFLLTTVMGWVTGILVILLGIASSKPPDVVIDSWMNIKNFVNLFFILVLIIMAFGTIFNIKEYVWSSLMPKFLASALLINFSMEIARYLVELSGGISQVFLNEVTKFGNTLDGSLANGLAISTFTTAGAANADGTLSAGAAYMAGHPIIGGIFIIIFLLFALFALLTATTFAFVRIPILWFLMILSPIAWFGYMIPKLKASTWTKWWSNFLQWTFFVPIYLFFLMFAVIFIQGKASVGAVVGSGPSGSFFDVFPLNDIIFYVLTLIFLVYGLKLAFDITGQLAGAGATSFGRMSAGIKRFVPGARVVEGIKTGLTARGKDIAERGVGIGGTRFFGAQNFRRTQMRTAELFGGSAAAGMYQGERAKQFTDERSRIERIMNSKKTDQEKLDFIKGQSGARGKTGAAAMAIQLENQRVGSFEEFKKALKNAGGEYTAEGKALVASLKKGGIKQLKISDISSTPGVDSDLLKLAKGEEVGGLKTEADVETRKLAASQLAKNNKINEIGDINKVAEMYADPNEKKEFYESIRVEAIKVKDSAGNVYDLSKKNERQAALKLADVMEQLKEIGNRHKELVNAMNEDKEIDSYDGFKNALEALGGKDSAEGAKLVKTVNAYNPKIWANHMTELAVQAGTVANTPTAKDAEINRLLDEKIKSIDAQGLRELSFDFHNDPAMVAMVKTSVSPRILGRFLSQTTSAIRSKY
ncbi:MAG: Uncharacterized protein CEN90_503 [Parcubacteria group bacterium Licking1014_17]|nr:MAG: Uncharacterized protein CEN90_503 [Parcubacteria group bacterium Licking1014_17]